MVGVKARKQGGPCYESKRVSERPALYKRENGACGLSALPKEGTGSEDARVQLQNQVLQLVLNSAVQLAGSCLLLFCFV